MNIETFKTLKNSPTVLILNEDIKNLISLLAVGNKRASKNYNKGGNQLLKNPKMQLLKDKIENKVNLVLNKLSEMNLNNLLYDFIESINKINNNDYMEIQKAFYVKMQADIGFVNIYLEFFKILRNVYKEVYNFDCDFFFKIIETKFLVDYGTNNRYPENLQFLNDYEDESKRINNLTIIRKMLKNNILLPEIEIEIDTLIINQNNYFADIYYWFQNEKISSDIKNKIKNKIINNSLPLREKVLLDNLLDPKDKVLKAKVEYDTTMIKKIITSPTYEPVKKIVIVKNIQDIDTLKLETENIIEEYLESLELDDIKEFIEERCKDALSKNKFCQYIFDKYFDVSMETSTKIIDLIKILVKKQILYKSNLSRGVLLIYSNWNDVSLDYNNPNKKMKELLICLKNMGITKFLETLLKTYKIEYEV